MRLTWAKLTALSICFSLSNFTISGRLFCMDSNSASISQHSLMKFSLASVSSHANLYFELISSEALQDVRKIIRRLYDKTNFFYGETNPQFGLKNWIINVFLFCLHFFKLEFEKFAGKIFLRCVFSALSPPPPPPRIC